MRTTQISPMLVMLGHRAPVTVVIQATVDGDFADLGPIDVIISAAEDGYGRSFRPRSLTLEHTVCLMRGHPPARPRPARVRACRQRNHHVEHG